MLSRIAESFFWLGRYVERAETTARMLAEHHQLITQDQSVEDDRACRILLDALGLADASVETADQMVDAVFGTPDKSLTIAGSVSSARQNVLGVRDAIPSDIFEALNSAHQWMTGITWLDYSPGITLYSLIERLILVTGTIESIMPRDEAYQFIQLGRNLERIDMTGRLLAMNHDSWWPEAGPDAALRSAGALAAFLKSGRYLEGEAVREYLVLDKEFPRSMLACALGAENAVREMHHHGATDSGRLLSEVGLLRSRLEFAIELNPASIDRLAADSTRAAFVACDAVRKAFFYQPGTIVWST